MCTERSGFCGHPANDSFSFRVVSQTASSCFGELNLDDASALTALDAAKPGGGGFSHQLSQVLGFQSENKARGGRHGAAEAARPGWWWGCKEACRVTGQHLRRYSWVREGRVCTVPPQLAAGPPLTLPVHLPAGSHGGTKAAQGSGAACALWGFHHPLW